jgi:hypothetical protein
MPKNTPEAKSFVVTATFAADSDRQDPEKCTFVFENNATLEHIFRTIFPVKGSINEMVFRPPVRIDISPDLTTVPRDKYSEVYTGEKEELGGI